MRSNAPLMGAFWCLIATLFCLTAFAPFPQIEAKSSEDMGWATGGICTGPLDCVLSSQNFCNDHGGVREVSYRSTLDAYSCQAICRDNTPGHTPDCAPGDECT